VERITVFSRPISRMSFLISIIWFGSSPGGLEIAGDYPHRGGLARRVRPEESYYLAFCHLERNRVHSKDRAVVLGQVFNCNHGIQGFDV